MKQVDIPFEKIKLMGDGNLQEGWWMMAKWWGENLQSKIERRFHVDDHALQCFFETEEDAMAFKLRWM